MDVSEKDWPVGLMASAWRREAASSTLQRPDDIMR